MRLTAFNCRKDEMAFFEWYSKQYGIELNAVTATPAMETIELAKDSQAISVITTPITAEMIDQLWEGGVRVISTRTVGYEHIDYRYAQKRGMVVSNVSYTPHTVAEYTVMGILMALRKMKTILLRSIGQDYSLKGIRGRELSQLTVGVIGTGKIGEMVIRNLSGFGCRILAYDLQPKDAVRHLAVYQPLDVIYRECDVITLHAPATAVSYHLINRNTIRQMKDGVVLVNTARGSLIDTKAFIEGLTAGKIGAAVLDVIEHEGAIYYRDFKYEIVNHPDLVMLSAMPNVLMTPHTAFFTDEAVSDMVEYSIRSCVQTLTGEENPWRVKEDDETKN